MKVKRYLFLGLFILMAAAFLPAEEENEIVQVTGTVRLVRSGPSEQLVITGSRVQWYIAREEEDMFKSLQQRTVTVEGEEIVTELANARRTAIRRELRNIKIIAVEE